MLFNSYRFLFLFLPITLLGYQLLGRYGRKPLIAWLAFASLVFYAAWNPAFVLFLLASIAVNYMLAQAIVTSPVESLPRKRLLFAGITLNLLPLFYFKYLAKVILLLESLHLSPVRSYSVLLPLGISFFTFTQISYLVDLAQGEADRQDFVSYLLFVTFFPHLIAGPLLHHKEMMPQFGEPASEESEANRLPRRFTLKSEDVSLGLTWFLLGLAKKVLIADKLAPQADLTFLHAGSLSAASALTGVIVYSMQLYFDFSGYSDMAIGLARLFSIRFPLNFDSPFKSTSVTEYWQRWHITLTRYITLYLYNPLLLAVQRKRLAHGLKISRKTLATPAGFSSMVIYPTLVTMLLTGLWHGAGLQFLVFGLIHGVYLIANQAWRHFRQRTLPEMPPQGTQRLAMMLGVYLQVTFALIFFRSSSMASAIGLLGDLAGLHGGLGHFEDLLAGSFAFVLFPVVWFMPNTQQILGQESAAHPPSEGSPAGAETGSSITHTRALSMFPGLRWRPSLAWGLAMAVLFFAVLVELDSTATFLYFQF